LHYTPFLGPGEYGDDVSERKNLGGTIGCEEPRFKELKNTTPGPGAYNVITISVYVDCGHHLYPCRCLSIRRILF
jgi:hypothetical protein